MNAPHDRRSFMKMTAGAGAALALASVGNPFVHAQGKKAIAMPALPYAENALEPFISARTVNLHYNRHHNDFYKTLKAYVDAHEQYQNLTLEELIMKNKDGILLDDTIFYVSVLLHNHNYYWQSLRPKSGGVPKGAIEKLIVASYGSYDAFRKAFVDESMKLGAGWVWVVLDGNNIKVYRTEYHDTPLIKGYRPLLAIDVWEHAYYLDYQDERQKYVAAVLDHLLNWNAVEKNLGKKQK
ncbi:MAG: superoxide dismutase [Chitinispirillaceae bacterium]|nr:superoxide dismutase [Chitinispirillaceae bacterium]